MIMAQTCKSPAGTGLSRDQLGGSSHLSNTEPGWPAQLIAARFGMDPARAKLVADFAFGGDRG